MDAGLEAVASQAPGLHSLLGGKSKVEAVQVDPQDDDQLRELLAKVISSSAWDKLDLPTDVKAAWQAYASRQRELSQAEKQTLGSFLSQWETLSSLALNGKVADGITPGLRARELKDEQGNVQFAAYAVNEGGLVPGVNASQEEQLLLIARTRAGDVVGLALAPLFERLTQQPSADGNFVEYVDERTGKPLLRADGYAPDSSQPNEKFLEERLDLIYGTDVKAMLGIYPRYQVLLPGIESYFYALDRNLTYNQVVRLKEALELFQRPAFQPFQAEIFTPDISYIILDKIEGATAGATFSGTGVVELDRRDLFGNRYQLASVIAHEGAHVLQGQPNAGDDCAEALRREIGDQTIPADFYNWTAEKLLEAVKSEKVGAYHVSLWVLAELGLKDLGWLQAAIRTGKVGTTPVVDCTIE